MGRQRSQKWYNKNEIDTLKKLGFTPTIRSGAGFIEKEDGYTDTLLCQLKSTDASSFIVKRNDIDKLEYHATVEHKLPIFIVQFLEDGKLYYVIESNDFQNVAKAMRGEECELKQDKIEIEIENVKKEKVKLKVKTDEKNRIKMNKIIEREREMRNEKFKKNTRRY